MGNDLLARLLLRQATLTTARCAGLLHGEYCSGESIGDLAARYGLDESTIEWWCRIATLSTPRDAPTTFMSADPTALQTYALAPVDDGPEGTAE